MDWRTVSLADGRSLDVLAGVPGPRTGLLFHDYYADMAQVNIDEFTASLAGEQALRDLLVVEGEPFRHVTGQGMVDALGDALPAADQVIATGEWAEGESFGLRRALEHGFDGWVDDDLAFVLAAGWLTTR